MSVNDNVVNLGAKRSDATGDAASWSPIELLRDLLAKLESGEETADAMVVMWSEPDDDPSVVHGRWLASSPNFHKTLGLIEHIKMRMVTSNG